MFFAIAIGTWRLSRISAVAGLTVFVLEKGYLMATVGPNGVRGVLLFLFIGYFLFQGVRGTFGYHRLIKAQPGSTQQSVQDHGGQQSEQS